MSGGVKTYNNGVDAWRMQLRSKNSSPSRSLNKTASAKYGKAVTGFSLDASANLDANYRTMRHLENEYIKSLQQQIYLLELENNYIRRQAADMVDKQPMMVSEASNSLKKIKEMQERMDGLKLEIHRKEGHIDILQQKLNHCEENIRETLLLHDKEKNELSRQCMTLRGERELALRESYQKDEQLKGLQYQISNQKSNITAMEIQLDILRAKLDDETKRANELEKSLIDSRRELIEFNTILRQLEAHYQQELNRIQSRPQTEFKDKIRQLEQKLGDAFLKSENDQYTKDKQTDRNDLLLKENVYLSNELERLRKMAEELVYQEKTYDNLLSGKLIKPDLTQEFEALKKERQMFVEHIKRINEEITEQRVKIDRLEKENSKPTNRTVSNDNSKNLLAMIDNNKNTLQSPLNEGNLSPVNITTANTSPTRLKPVDEEIIQAMRKIRS
ncbi:unnamed protein product [Heterobilharzia americana]|nr:unnamed protein product [Heterobilharzia americana]